MQNNRNSFYQFLMLLIVIMFSAIMMIFNCELHKKDKEIKRLKAKKEQVDSTKTN